MERRRKEAQPVEEQQQGRQHGNNPNEHAPFSRGIAAMVIASEGSHRHKSKPFCGVASPRIYDGTAIFGIMVRTLSLLLWLLCTWQFGQAQLTLPLTPDPAGQGMGAHVPVFERYYQPAGNPAILSDLESGGLSVYTLHPFGLSELATSMIQGWVSQGRGGWGGGLGYFGFAGLRQISLYSGFGHRLWNRLDVGLQAEGHFMRLSDYGRLRSFGVNAGMRVALRPRLQLGVVIHQPLPVTREKAARTAERLQVQLAHRLSDDVALSAEWVQEQGRPADIRLGLLYLPVPYVPIRIGYQSLTSSSYFGIGLEWRNRWHLDMACGLHPFLGVTPSAGVRHLFIKT